VEEKYSEGVAIKNTLITGAVLSCLRTSFGW